MGRHGPDFRDDSQSDRRREYKTGTFNRRYTFQEFGWRGVGRVMPKVYWNNNE